MQTCPHCRKDLTRSPESYQRTNGDSSATGSGNAARIWLTEELKQKSYLMMKGELKEHEAKFISDIPRYPSLSEKQWKWFAVIYKNCFGEWPKTPTPDDVNTPKPAVKEMDEAALDAAF